MLCGSFPIQAYRRQRQREAAKHGSANSTSIIDSVARIMFPLSFAFFNFAYWYSYFQAQAPFDWEEHALKGRNHTPEEQFFPSLKSTRSIPIKHLAESVTNTVIVTVRRTARTHLQYVSDTSLSNYFLMLRLLSCRQHSYFMTTP